MDHKTTLTQHINAPADAVWAVVSDIPGSAATLSGVESIQMLTERTLCRGYPLEGNPHHDGARGNGGDVGCPVRGAVERPGRQHHCEGPPGRRRLHHQVRARGARRREPTLR